MGVKNNNKLIISSSQNPFKILDFDSKLNEYWISPFGKCIDLTEEEFIYDIKPIMIVGAKGCGKTTLLKYYSYEYQKKIVKKDNYKVKDTFWGIFLEHDEDILAEIDKIFVFDETLGNRLFDKYIETSIFIKISSILLDLYYRNEINNKHLTKIFFGFSFDEVSNIRSPKKLEEIQQVIKQDFLNSVENFKNNEYPASKYRIDIEQLISSIKENLDFMHIIRVIVMIDEYEKYGLLAQKKINSIMKYIDNNSQYTIRATKANINLKTYATINEDEYLKANSDYKEVHFLNIFDMPRFKGYLEEVCNKRFELSGLPGYSSRQFLGFREDLVKEAREVTGGRISHFQILGENINKHDVIKIAYPENPLIEMMNILYVLRDKNFRFKNRGEIIDSVKMRMEAFLEKDQSEFYKKYKNDYSNKYKLSLLILLCDIYGIKKKYYSFNTLAYLVSGNVRLFLELIEKIWDEALQNNWDGLNPIESSIQSDIVYNILHNKIRRIKEKNHLLFRMAYILGITFREYHQDQRVKYPETNQFSLYGKTSENLKEIIDEAMLECIIFKKKKLQQKSIGLCKGEIYVLNRIFAPTFQLSYRIRGGYIKRFECDDLESKIFSEGKYELENRCYQICIFNNMRGKNHDIFQGDNRKKS